MTATTAARSLRGKNNKPYERETIIAALHGAGGVIAAAAKKLHIHRQRLFEWIKEDDELRVALDETRDIVLDLAESQLLKAIKEGSEKSVHFYLRTIGRSRGYSERMEHTGKDGEPMAAPMVQIDFTIKIGHSDGNGNSVIEEYHPKTIEYNSNQDA